MGSVDCSAEEVEPPIRGASLPSALSGLSLAWTDDLLELESRCGPLRVVDIPGCAEDVPRWRLVSGGVLSDLVGTGTAAFVDRIGLVEITFDLKRRYGREELPELADAIGERLGTKPRVVRPMPRLFLRGSKGPDYRWEWGRGQRAVVLRLFWSERRRRPVLTAFRPSARRAYSKTCEALRRR